MTETTQHLGTGRRKTAIARVRLSTGTGKILVNGRAFNQYFPLDTLRMHATQPLITAGVMDKVDVKVNVTGGGPHRPGRRRASGHRPGVAAPGWQSASRVEGGGPAHAGCPRKRTQEVRPAGCAQAVSVLETVNRFSWADPAGVRLRGFSLASAHATR